MDAQVRDEAKSLLTDLFRKVGEQNPQQESGGLLGGLDIAQELQEFVEMPVELAMIFIDMSVELAELVLTSLAKAGYTLVKGLTPA